VLSQFLAIRRRQAVEQFDNFRLRRVHRDCLGCYQCQAKLITRLRQSGQNPLPQSYLIAFNQRSTAGHYLTPHELPAGGCEFEAHIMITNKIFAAAAAIVVSVLSGVAVAQTAAPTAPVAAAPAAEKQVDPAVAKFRAVCKADIDKLCGAEIAAAKAAAPVTTDPAAKGQGRGEGRGAMGACMTKNEANLSTECKTAWTERKAAWAAKKS
jgi:hypothetical protein